jgi:hypothetical protein
MFGFIRAGRVTSIADLYGYHTQTRRDLEFTGFRIGPFRMFGVLHARPVIDRRQPRFPADATDLGPDYAVEPSAAPLSSRDFKRAKGGRAVLRKAAIERLSAGGPAQK